MSAKRQVGGVPVKVWKASFVGVGDTLRIATVSFDATVTNHRVRVHGSGSFRSDEYFSPDSVNYTEAGAVSKLLLVIDRDRQHAEYLLAECAKQEALIVEFFEEQRS